MLQTLANDTELTERKDTLAHTVPRHGFRHNEDVTAAQNEHLTVPHMSYSANWDFIAVRGSQKVGAHGSLEWSSP